MSEKFTTLPKVFIGTWALGDEYWGEQTHSDSLKTIHAAVREGFKSFDTAPVYGKGRSEQLLGQQLKGDHSYVISTKSFIKPPAAVKKSIENSLNRLRRDYIDYFFIHWPSTYLDSRPIVELLHNLKNEGKIKNVGVSNFNIEELNKAREAGKIDIVQNSFNFFWPFNSELFKYCNKEGIKTQAYSPLAQGLLTGKVSKDNPYIKSDQRYKMALYSEENLDVVYRNIDKLKDIAAENEISLYGLIINWMKNLDYIDSFIVGCRKREQVESLHKSLNRSIENETMDKVTKLSKNLSGEIVKGDNIFNHSY